MNESNVKEVLSKNESQHQAIHLSPDHVEVHGIRFRKGGVFYKGSSNYKRIFTSHDNW